MAATIISRLDLSGQGVSSDALKMSETQTFNVTEPSIESGALTLTTSYQILGNMNSALLSVERTMAQYLYIKNTDTTNSIEIRNGLSSAASGYIVFTGVPTMNGTITIIDTAGESQDYIAATTENTTLRNFINTNPAAAVASLKACIEAANGHAGSIIAVAGGVGAATSTCDSAALTLTQNVGGLAGNTTITPSTSGTTLLNTCVTSFTLGTDNTKVPLSTLRPGQFATIPITKEAVIQVASQALTATCEYGYWSVI